MDRLVTFRYGETFKYPILHVFYVIFLFYQLKEVDVKKKNKNVSEYIDIHFT